ncbi:placenta-specific protein 9 [Lates japonicus]|uniref:Placenta-specific protein 9 n=1 Tax=Lates japonicus TaxID=270547 RepID=A0AAD3NEP5_LATJO|nr:placenta-specific protein 9 [Lates japonicus]
MILTEANQRRLRIINNTLPGRQLYASTPSPEPDLRPRAVRSSACQEHTNLHSRLDVVEKKVEDTVEKLEAELAALLDEIEAPKWRPLLDNTGKTAVDILEDPEQRGQS